MYKLLLTSLLAFVLFDMTAQSVQWASKVISFSSEYSDPLLGKEYRALHILGRPSKYPKFAASPSAWQSLTPDNPNGEYLIVAFDSLKQIKQVAIFENFGAKLAKFSYSLYLSHAVFINLFEFLFIKEQKQLTISSLLLFGFNIIFCLLGC